VALTEAKERSSIPPLSILIDDKKLEEGTINEVSLLIHPANLVALQMALKVHNAEVLAVSTSDLPQFGTGNYAIFNEKGLITLAWANTQAINAEQGIILNIKLKTTKSAKLSEILSLQDNVTEGLAYDVQGNGAPLQLKFIPQVSKVTLLPSSPNPFKDETTISFIMPEEGTATLSVFDMSGRLVHQRNNQVYARGLNAVKLAITDPSVTGLLICRLTTATQTLEQKLVITR
jgi:hypothetical protein